MIDTLYRYWCELVLEHRGWVLNGAIALLVGVFSGFLYIGHRRRRARFMDRPILDEDTWFATYYPIAPIRREQARFALNAFAEDIGIHWTQLRPSDTFEEMLCVERRFDIGDDLEGASLVLGDRAGDWGAVENSLPGFNGPLLVFLNRWVDIALHNEPPFAHPLVSPSV